MEVCVRIDFANFVMSIDVAQMGFEQRSRLALPFKTFVEVLVLARKVGFIFLFSDLLKMHHFAIMNFQIVLLKVLKKKFPL